MFGDLNRAEVLGNITHDLELRHTNSGTPVCSFRIATNRRYQQDSEWKEQTEFHNVVIWGQRAESFVQRARKGTRLFVEGRLSTRSWEDENGKTHYNTEIVTARLILIDRYEKGENQSSPSDISPSETPAKDSKKDEKKPKEESDESIDPDDLPF
jgi:single-strand DNA-binding protein